MCYQWVLLNAFVALEPCQGLKKGNGVFMIQDLTLVALLHREGRRTFLHAQMTVNDLKILIK